MSEDVECIPCKRINNRQSVDLVLQQRRHGIIQTRGESERSVM